MVVKADKFQPRHVRVQLTKKGFLDQITKSANISEAARVAGIDRGTAYNWRQTDPDFNAKWERIVNEADGAQILELVDAES